jgi:hypothetical protein
MGRNNLNRGNAMDGVAHYCRGVIGSGRRPCWSSCKSACNSS